jgi:hypothetical protein
VDTHARVIDLVPHGERCENQALINLLSVSSLNVYILQVNDSLTN